MSELRITEVNYDSITDNYIDFLRSQEEFKDLDFEASVIRRLISLLAYDLHYAAFYANAAFKEHFLDSAALRSSVVSHSKRYGYVPASERAASALVDVRLENGTAILNQYIELPKGSNFTGTTRDRSKIYNFVTTETHNIFADSTDLTFKDVKLVQGQYSSYDFRVDDYYQSGVIELPSDDIDTRYLEVYVQAGSDDNRFEVYQNAVGTLTKADSKVYWLEEGPNGRFQIYFGDDVIGKSVPRGRIVKVVYIRTNGAVANNIEEFAFSSSTQIFQSYLTSAFSSIIVSPLTLSNGGSDPESTEDIRFRAQKYRGNGQNALRIQDYEERILQEFPEITSLRVWDATYLDNPAAQIGKIFISAIPSGSLYFTKVQKTSLLNQIQNTIAGTNKCFEFVDPSYIFPKLSIKIERNAKVGKYNDASLRQIIKELALSYNKAELNKFGSRLEPSNLSREIHDLDSTIDNILIDVSLELRIIPCIGETAGYASSFDNEIFPGSFTSESFSINGTEVFVKDDSNGKLTSYRKNDNSVSILNFGSVNYATGQVEIFPTIVSKGSAITGDIRLKAQAKNRNITTREGRALRLEEDCISVNFTPFITSTSNKYS